MANMRMDKNQMPEQAPDVRNRNFQEVALGYTEARAVDEARRCLHCKNKPCVSGCPVGALRVRLPRGREYPRFYRPCGQEGLCGGL